MDDWTVFFGLLSYYMLSIIFTTFVFMPMIQDQLGSTAIVMSQNGTIDPSYWQGNITSGPINSQVSVAKTLIPGDGILSKVSRYFIFGSPLSPPNFIEKFIGIIIVSITYVGLGLPSILQVLFASINSFGVATLIFFGWRSIRSGGG